MIRSVAAVLLVAVAGCATESGTSSPRDLPSNAPAEVVVPLPGPEEVPDPLAGTTAVPTGRFADALARAVDQAGPARVEIENRTAETTLVGRGYVDYSTSPPSAQVVLADGSTPLIQVDALLVDGVLYLRDDTQPWTMAPSDEPKAADIARLLDPLGTFGATAPYVTDVRHVVRDVEGEDWDEYATRAGFDDGERADLTWTFDPAGYLRALSADLGEDGGGEFDFRFGDWGEPASIDAAPAGA